MILDKIRNVGSADGVVRGFLRPIDTQRIAADLKLDRLCLENGRRNTPPSDAVRPDSIEQAIIQKIQSEWEWQGGELLNQLRTYAVRLLERSIAAEFQKLQLMGRNTVTQLQAAHHRALAELGPLGQTYRAYRDDLQNFRARHRLQRAPRDPGRRWTALGLLFVMIAIESMLNGIFFGEGAARGYIGGVGTAIGISAFNVIFAFLLGWGPARWLNHRNLVAKLCGFLLLLAGSTMLIGLHAFAMHLRDATVRLAAENPLYGPDEPMRMAVANLLSTPWIISDLSSAYLLGLGVLFGFFALLKGYTFDDPYPGYGAHNRRAASAREDYSDEHAELFDELERTKETTVKNLRAGIGEIPNYPQQAAAIRANRSATLGQFRAYEVAVETAANQLLAQYRNCNRQARTDTPPAYFNQPWSLPHRFADGVGVSELLVEPELPTIDLNTALKELHDLSTNILDEYTKLMRDYPHPTQMG